MSDSGSRTRILGPVLVVAVAALVYVVASRNTDAPPGGAPTTTSSGAPAPVERPASAATRAALGGLAPGMRVGTFDVESVSEPTAGAVFVRTKQGAVFEIRLAADEPPPPAKAGPYAVYYRRPKPEGGTIGGNEDLVAGAQAIAEIVGHAPAGTPPLPGVEALTAAKGVPL